ncbi:MAG: Flagellar biosynthetic protein FlhB [Phycisphaerae bacterium]|nr:Flagellar biosynthetic protein FlhB [Phycisphaerae bacterium]
MADHEEMGEKTERPTPHKLQEARESGQVAKSTDLTAALALLGALVTLNLLGPSILRQLAGLTGRMLGGDGSLRPESMLASARASFSTAANVVLPLVLAAAAAAFLANLVQVGFIATWRPVMPDFNKINPIAGLGRLFSSRNLVKMLVNIGKIVLIAWVCWATISARMEEITGLMSLDFWGSVGASAELVYVLAIRVSLVLLVLAILDFAFQRYQHEKQLMMSRHELREELKRMEGDPTLRARRRNVARQLAMQRIAAEVPRADVIVTNPTHVAVALKYDPQAMGAPRVVAKGADLMAEQIRKIAIQNRVPIVRRAPLARALFAACDIGDQVPVKFYKAVAEVLAYVYELAGRGRRKSRVLAATPSVN